MNMNASKRYLWGGGVVAVIVVGVIVGAIRPHKHAQAALGSVPEVQVVHVQQQDVPIIHEWIGTFDGLVNADVRAQVTGYLLTQGYQEGSFVKKGQLLFQIDPRQAQLQVGALVAPAAGPVTSVSTVDPIKVYFTVGEPQYLAFRKRFPTEASTRADQKTLRIELVLADGSTYPRLGSFDFADRQVNESTGTIRIAALFPNPNNILRPGGYAKVRVFVDVQHEALLVPQRAVSELQGSYQVAVVDSDNKIGIRPVKVGVQTDDRWVISDGLKPGDLVVVEGTQKVSPGMHVNPKPFTANATDR
jgi:multidrug efflux pump subunit AcrA (membrane-fusion protein)